jgi:8-oxo-dGTP pyrophosphatase MutT (NUDIX family)
MLDTKKFFTPLLIALTIISISNITICMETPQVFDLDTYRCNSASVSTLYTHKDKLRIILTREAHGASKGTYDDFSGGRNKGETNPQTSAAREFSEEAILPKTIELDLKNTEKFIAPTSKNTMYVLAYSKDPKTAKGRKVRNVTYLVDFDLYATTLFDNFYGALESEKTRYKKLHTKGSEQHTTEKDSIAAVLWDDFKDATINHKKTVDANVLNPKTKRFEKKQITLRPFLTSKYRPYFLGQPYDQGTNCKIRHYHANAQQESCSLSESAEESQ